MANYWIEVLLNYQGGKRGMWAECVHRPLRLTGLQSRAAGLTWGVRRLSVGEKEERRAGGNRLPPAGDSGWTQADVDRSVQRVHSTFCTNVSVHIISIYCKLSLTPGFYYNPVELIMLWDPRPCHNNCHNHNPRSCYKNCYDYNPSYCYNNSFNHNPR